MASVVLGLGGATAASAQTAPTAVTSPAATAVPAPKKKSHSVSGSPLDTIRSTHMYANVAPAKDFVKERRPDPKTLDYSPLTGVDPVRPKPRDAANVLALQAELERSLAVNEGRGGMGKGGAGKKARKAAR